MSRERTIKVAEFETDHPAWYVDVSVYHSRLGREYRLRVLPMQRVTGDIVSYGLLDGIVLTLEDAPRFSTKRLAALAEKHRGAQVRDLAEQAARKVGRQLAPEASP